jgi:hypothetical protein
VRNWFQIFAFKFNLYRYSVEHPHDRQVLKSLEVMTYVTWRGCTS